jgi:hypothetical protein
LKQRLSCPFLDEAGVFDEPLLAGRTMRRAVLLCGLVTLLGSMLVAAQNEEETSVLEPDVCAEGEFLWARSLDLQFCTVICALDSDCPIGEQCRVLGTADPNEELPSVGLCDPFWDIEGSLTAALDE